MTITCTRIRWNLAIISLLWPLVGNGQEAAADDDPVVEQQEQLEQHTDAADGVRLYRSPEERREAGLGTPLTDWLTFSGLIEVEQEASKFYFANHVEHHERPQSSQDLQLGFVVEAFGWLEAELIYEAEHERHFHDERDEALIGVDLDGMGFKIGRIYVPFGEYYSHLASGPALEFGETRANALVIDYTVVDWLELSAFAFEGRIDAIGERDQVDWGYLLALQSEDEAVRFGVSYLSDLSEAKESLLDKTSRTFLRRVAGWNAYLLWGFDAFELTLETTRAARSFGELDRHIDRPTSQNLELAYFQHETLQYAVRVEHNRELEDEPEWRYGIGLAMLLADQLLISVDYLHSDFEDRFVYDNNDNELFYGRKLTAQLALEF